jgi:hypothetical protein
MYDTISAFVGVQYSVNFQNARCNNKDCNEILTHKNETDPNYEQHHH